MAGRDAIRLFRVLPPDSYTLESFLRKQGTRRNILVLSVVVLTLSAGGVSMSGVGLASDGSSANDSNKANVNIESQRQLAGEDNAQWSEDLPHDAGTRTAMGGPHLGDISVSRIGYNSTGSSSYSEYGVVGDIAAFTAATTACNVGTETLEWFSGSSGRHPLRTQNMYRLSADGERFEMIGMNWVTHAFCALNETGCGSCQPTNCSTLGIGCASSNTASRAGATNLGPRRDINPLGTRFDGVGPGTHDHPYSSPESNSTIAGRLQVNVNDLSVPGAEYYIEIHYVTHDEGLSNRYNNASWMHVNMPPYPYTGDIINVLPIHQFEVALNAWQEEWEESDTPVIIQAINDAEQGRFHLGRRISDNGDGVWHYEYALHNMNSHLGASRFEIPIPEGVVVANVGFHDVFYHSGDGHPGEGNFDGTDWAAEDAGSGGNRTLSWSTSIFDENPNGNALRWGSTYNFRFDANTPPQDAEITLVQYRGSAHGPGQPASLLIAARGPSPLTGGCACPFDSDLSGEVDAFDLANLLGCWGPVEPATCECMQAEPIDDVIDAGDLASLLGAWGRCSP